MVNINDKKFIDMVRDFIKNNFFSNLESKITDISLKSFNIHPFTLIALTNSIFVNITPINAAKVLLYPRILGTSFSTIFGDRMQKFCVEYLGASASGITGMDIEFVDKKNDQEVIMQLKAGPNTINKDDVEPIIESFKQAIRLKRTNKVNVMPTFAMGITYGTIDQISGHYKKIMNTDLLVQPNIPVYIGKDFWERITGTENFYSWLVSQFIAVSDELDYSTKFDTALKKLAKEIETRCFPNEKFDPTLL